MSAPDAGTRALRVRLEPCRQCDGYGYTGGEVRTTCEACDGFGVVVPAGFVVVPREPSEEMLDAAFQEWLEAHGPIDGREDLRVILRAALSAAEPRKETGT